MLNSKTALQTHPVSLQTIKRQHVILIKSYLYNNHSNIYVNLFRKKKAPHLIQGEAAETGALEYLTGQGLSLVCRNYRCKSGEIDLVMYDRDFIVFVEVRYRKSNKYGSAAESITPLKQSRIINAASHYLVSSKAKNPVRFDVVTITANGTDQPCLNWIKNAFQC